MITKNDYWLLIIIIQSGIAPAEQFQFVPASELTHENALSNLSIYFLSAVSTVQAFLPSLLSQKSVRQLLIIIIIMHH